MEKSKRTHTQASIPRVEAKRLGRPKQVTMSVPEKDLRLILSCLLIAQEKHAGILTWSQERAAGNIAGGIHAALARAN